MTSRYHRSRAFAASFFEPGLSYGRRIATIHEHSIIAVKEGQRNSGNLAVFGIKNARRERRSSSQDKLPLIGGIKKTTSRRPSAGLLKPDISCCINRL